MNLFHDEVRTVEYFCFNTYYENAFRLEMALEMVGRMKDTKMLNLMSLFGKQLEFMNL